ncbi:branched-chain amino acid aminotransferase [Bordetella petrii]|uniref:branched-chain-amino-acid transaminase n=1 Tax=Bordetella petrii (strain ATCC BAA-461 / DSM 12804 / CCUG 43448 / CIP 107267 / Se-1111R) TaxID=340100 RepID=A9II99_BORPD|nr:branched-chain amino acid aminotransferase [Bordetella petrii]CAP42057.1 putative aminotransferase [Bordetella petrii]
MDAIYWHDGQWTTDNPKLLGPADHAFWMASMVFDGARAFDGLTPDLDLHCQRVVRSAEKMLMKPRLGWQQIRDLCLQAVARFPAGEALYIKPMFFCAAGFLLPEAEQTQFVLHVFKVPMPGDQGFSACFSSFARAWSNMAPTDAKASCLYPNGQRAIREAMDKGFDNAIMLDGDGHVAEFATANLWIAKDGVVSTPADNGTFLNGITRQRVLALLRADGVDVQERALTRADVEQADEVFSTGNYGKVVHVNRVEDRSLPYGPMARRAHGLYMEYARGGR